MSDPIVRLVCGDCLRSVELSADRFERPPQMCPFCGGVFESQLDEIPTHLSSLGRPLSLELSSREQTLQSDPVDHKRLGHVGRFQIRETLGGGGFGHVHRAHDPRLDRDVALKVLQDTQPGARVMERFFREARAAARLDHPNIVALHEAGRDDGQCWIAYQYVPGRTLTRFQEQTTIDFETAARLVRGLAAALVHAHERGVFHRDLKPSNVIIDKQGQPRLTDFGLAKRLDFDSTLTREGTVLGTPAYMSPEQAEGRGHLADARSDIYSLGVILYEMLCGRRPTNLLSSEPLGRATPMPPAPPTQSVNPNIPAALDRVCERALAHNLADRYPDAQSMLGDLDRWLEHQRTRKRRVYNRAGLAALFALSAVGLYSAGFSTNAGDLSRSPGASRVPGGTTRSRTVEAPAPAKSESPQATDSKLTKLEFAGTVVYPDGTPAGETEVLLTDGHIPVDLDGKPMLPPGQKRHHGGLPIVRGRGRTDAGGLFRFEVGGEPIEETDRVIFWAYRPGVLATSLEIKRTSLASGEPNQIQLRAPANSDFKVLGPDGNPVAGARIVPAALSRDMLVLPFRLRDFVAAVTDAEGKATITALRPEEIACILITTARFGMQQWTAHVFGDGNSLKVVSLLPVGRLKGHVVDHGGKAASGLKLLVMTIPESTPGPCIGFVDTATDALGRFEIPALPAGNLFIRLQAPDLKAQDPTYSQFFRFDEKKRIEQHQTLELEISLDQASRLGNFDL